MASDVYLSTTIEILYAFVIAVGSCYLRLGNTMLERSLGGVCDRYTSDSYMLRLLNHRLLGAVLKVFFPT